MGRGGGGNLFNKQKKSRPRDNKKQNRQIKELRKIYNISNDKRRELHDLAHKENMGFRELLDHADDWYKKK